jgi:hypothetical protein
MTPLEKAEQRIARATKARELARVARDKAMRDLAAKCSWCGEESPLSAITLIQTHWYTSPHGCTGGDYWNVGERAWECPACKRCCRDLDYKQRDCSLLPAGAKAEHFAAHRDCYCDGGRECSDCCAHREPQSFEPGFIARQLV